MCLILFAYHSHPVYPLILAANRDEFYQRKTLNAHWWSECPDLLAGRDLEAGGTWMGVTRTGRVAAVTNVREPQMTSPAPCSRGLLTRRYLEEDLDDERFSGLLQQTQDQYRGYNLLFGNFSKLHYYSNRGNKPALLSPGIYGLSNAQLDTPWPKVQQGKKSLIKLLDTSRLDTEKLHTILESKEIVVDNLLPSTGVSLDWERKLSAICISGPDYGTRSSTVLLIDQQGSVQFHEKILAPEPAREFRCNFQLHK
jgi:uncharacterized protein with NRDE domain